MQFTGKVVCRAVSWTTAPVSLSTSAILGIWLNFHLKRQSEILLELDDLRKKFSSVGVEELRAEMRGHAEKIKKLMDWQNFFFNIGTPCWNPDFLYEEVRNGCTTHPKSD